MVLKKANNVRLSLEIQIWAPVPLSNAVAEYELRPREYEEFIQTQALVPTLVNLRRPMAGRWRLWGYRNKFYWDPHGLSGAEMEDEIHLSPGIVGRLFGRKSRIQRAVAIRVQQPKPAEGSVRIAVGTGRQQQEVVFSTAEYDQLMGHVLQDGVAELAQLGSRTLWATDGEFYWDEEGFTLEEAQLEVWDLKRRRDRKYDRLRKVRERGEETEVARREQIPEEVRDFVWNRDEGRCARCGAEDDLQFDHVIPVSKGGGSSADNLQILCGECNRKKGASIG